jgi:hypothetical protein
MVVVCLWLPMKCEKVLKRVHRRVHRLDSRTYLLEDGCTTVWLVFSVGLLQKYYSLVHY